MNEQERSTHFQGYAKLLLPELDSLFILLYQAYATGEMAKRDEYSQRIQTLLAERGYDLVRHALDTCPDIEFEAQGGAAVYAVPDLTVWPKHENPPHSSQQ